MAGVPTWSVFVATLVVVIIGLELGRHLGCVTHRRSPKEKESPITTFVTAMLGLLAFILGFTFNLVAERYTGLREDVRDEANAIQTAYLRADVLPEPDRTESKAVLERYVAESVRAYREGSLLDSRSALALTNEQHDRLWDIAMANARKDPSSNVVALYVESLGEVFEERGERAMIERAERIRLPIWGALYGLTFLAVLGVGYQTGVAGSKRTKAGLFLAASFALVMGLIADLDRVDGYVRVSQRPFEDLQGAMAETKQQAASAEAR